MVLDLVDFQVFVGGSADSLVALAGESLEGVLLLSTGVPLVDHFPNLAPVAHHQEVGLLHLLVVDT